MGFPSSIDLEALATCMTSLSLQSTPSRLTSIPETYIPEHSSSDEGHVVGVQCIQVCMACTSSLCTAVLHSRVDLVEKAATNKIAADSAQHADRI